MNPRKRLNRVRFREKLEDFFDLEDLWFMRALIDRRIANWKKIERQRRADEGLSETQQEEGL